MISKKFCWGTLARVTGCNILICCISSLAFSWENCNNSVHMELVLTTTSSCLCSHQTTALHARGGRLWWPQDSRGYGSGHRCLVGCSRQPWPYCRGRQTHLSRSPAPAERKKNDNRGGSPVQKVVLFPLKIFTIFKTQAMPCLNITITTVQRPMPWLNVPQLKASACF